MLKQQLQADKLKLSKTPFFILHLVIPLLGLVAFISYQLMTHYSAEALTINYYQLLTLIYPLIATWMCTLTADQEIEAGGGFFLLNTTSRSSTLLSKLLFLIGSGLFACLFVVVGYRFIIGLFLTNYSLPFNTNLELALVIWGCALFQYFFHFWIGLCFGRNVNFAVATFELLLSALLITGLGETIWFFFPCAWGIRLIPLVAASQPAIKLGFGALGIGTLLMLAFLFNWFQRWEGRKNEE
ncbi:lantibiotic immunity ABC transporter MutG family permease subunit [Enterococcus sp. AZ163]|uniref:lantibiotic immunity ABC transporter MutG family permease subunit n=1 Tax=Enterococcus sp. AZ163 TaxID=2774638 RepID=UPI003D27A77B